MRRPWLAPIAGIALLTLSCGHPADEALRAPAIELAGAPEAGGAPLAALPAAAVPAAPVDSRVETLAAWLETKPTGLTRPEVNDLARAVLAEAGRYQLDPGLVLAVMHVESRYHTFAVSPVGAMGLMQLLPATAKELAEQLGIPWQGTQTLFDPVVNVQLGTAYVKQLRDRYGSVKTALAAYNWGPGHIDRRLRSGESLPQVYPALVLDAYGKAARPRAS
jgi:soluble lytic murein transglycosylase-like protein